MPTLSPTLAANIALNVYQTENATMLADAQEEDANLKMGDAFNFEKNNVFSGKAGWLLLKAKSGFGFVAKGSGVYQGELRGVDPSRVRYVGHVTGLCVY